jgi:hypothetical protein
MQPTTGAGRSNVQDRLGRTPNQCGPARREHAGRGHHPSPYCWYGHHGVADADRTVLRAVAGDLQPQHVINLPFWSTLMLEFEAWRSTTGHDHQGCTPLLTSTEAGDSEGLIMRLLASGL